MQTYITSPNVYYRHSTVRNKQSTKSDRNTWFLAGVEEFTPATSLDIEANKWILWLPNGCTMGTFDNAEDALGAAPERLVLDGWTTDRGRAERRAQKELELRLSGRLSFKKGRESDFFAAKKEIMQVI